MSVAYTFKDVAFEILSSSDIQLSVKEIWNVAIEKNLIVKLSSTGKTPTDTLAAQLYTDIKNSNSRFVQISKRPATFGLKSKNYNVLEDCKIISEPKVKRSFNERHLHKLLSTFVRTSPDFNCYTRTIYHEQSNKSRKGKNEWLHPDIVGVYYPFNDYSSETLKLYDVTIANPYKLFSFELKIKLDYSNIREYYFQSVSNSSWANEGYLVALDIEDDIDFLEELKRLNNSFGIGIIKLNPTNISQSEIILSARNNNQLDFNTIDRLVIENPNFKEFISDISLDTQDVDPRLRGEYDSVFDDDESTKKYCDEKGI